MRSYMKRFGYKNKKLYKCNICLYTFLFLTVFFLLQSTSYSQNTTDGFQLQSIIEVQNSIGHDVTNALVSVIVSNTGLQETINEQTLYYTHTGNGRYVYEGAILTGYTEVRLEIRAPGHSTLTRQLTSVPLNQAYEIYHSDYVERCNETELNSGWLGNSDWDNCDVDPDRLIETFGVLERLLPNSAGSGTTELLPGISVHKYYPTIRNDGIAYISRYNAYKTVLENLAVSYSLFHSYIYGTTLYDAVSPALNNGTGFSVHDIDMHSVAFAVEFSDMLEDLGPLFSAAGYSFDLMRVHREGQFKASLLYAGYLASMDRFIEIFENRVEGTWLKEDNAFINAFQSLKNDYQSLRESKHEEFVSALISRDLNNKIGEIISSKSLSAALGYAGKQLSNVLVSGANVKLLALSVKLGFVYLITDFGNSVIETGRQHALLFVLAQLDRELFDIYPDNFDVFPVERYRTRAFFHSIIRLQMGIMFNEIRAGLYGGEYRSWAGRTWDYIFPEVMSQEQAYRVAVVNSSNSKIESALDDLEQLKSILYTRLKPEIEVEADDSLGQYPSHIADLQYGVWYRINRSQRSPYMFFKRDGNILVQQGDGNVHSANAYGLALIEKNPSFPNYYLVRWASAHGANQESFSFGKDQQGRYYADITCDTCDEPSRFYAQSSRPVNICDEQRARVVAVNFFSPTCSNDPASYTPLTRLNLTGTGRTAYIFASCAGPATRGRFTYLIVEERTDCIVSGTMTLYDPYPEFKINKKSPENFGGKAYNYAVPSQISVQTSGMLHKFKYDLQHQEYRSAGVESITDD